MPCLPCENNQKSWMWVEAILETEAIIGMFFQNGLTGEAWGDWSLYTDSPLRALTPAQECIAGTGGPFPENYWDPAGITSKKSEEDRNQGIRMDTDFTDI